MGFYEDTKAIGICCPVQISYTAVCYSSLNFHHSILTYFPPLPWNSQPHHVEKMARMTVAIFEILERAWASCDVTLVDMKIEFGFVVGEEEDVVVLADVIDSDSWRIWPKGDKRQMKDKQVSKKRGDVIVVLADVIDSLVEDLAQGRQAANEGQTGEQEEGSPSCRPR